jgi:hypothetical protein
LRWNEKKERERTMTIEEAIVRLKNIQNFGRIQNMERETDFHKSLDMAIHSLEMQKELAEYSGMDICQFVEDYDYEENDISEYEYEDSVDNFLIDEAKKGGRRMTREESNARRICCPMCDKKKCDREADDCDVKRYLENRSEEE